MRENGVKKPASGKLSDPTVYNKHLVNNSLLMKATLELIAEDGCLDCTGLSDDEQLRLPDGEIIAPLICGAVSGNPADKYCPSCLAKDALEKLK